MCNHIRKPIILNNLIMIYDTESKTKTNNKNKKQKKNFVSE